MVLVLSYRCLTTEDVFSKEIAVRKTLASCFVLAFIFLFAPLACAQSVPSVPSDYSTWQSNSGRLQAVHNGNRVTLVDTSYFRSSQSTLLDERVSVLKDENNRDWLLLYVYLQHTPDHQNEDSPHFNVFEYRNGNWVHVRDFPNSTNFVSEMADFLKSRYDLEL